MTNTNLYNGWNIWFYHNKTNWVPVIGATIIGQQNWSIFDTSFDTNSDLNLIADAAYRRKILNRDVADSVEEFFGNKFLKSKISSNIALAEAPSQGKDIFSYNKNCKGAEDYAVLVDEILQSGVF